MCVAMIEPARCVAGAIVVEVVVSVSLLYLA